MDKAYLDYKDIMPDAVMEGIFDDGDFVWGRNDSGVGYIDDTPARVSCDQSDNLVVIQTFDPTDRNDAIEVARDRLNDDESNVLFVIHEEGLLAYFKD